MKANADKGKCFSCGADIVWQVTKKGKRIPLDPTMVVVTDARGETHRGRVAHFATCPSADKHRRGT